MPPESQSSDRRRVILVGGGFAGTACARTLRHRLDAGWELVLFNRENHLVFHPLLAEVVGASVNPDAVAAPLRQMLPGVVCRTEEVRHVDLARSRVEYTAHDGHPAWLEYRHVVVAGGNAVNLGMVPGMADHAFPLKTVGDAMTLRAHVMQQMEKAEVCGEPERRRWYLSFVVVGGGYSGVEAAGEINDLARSSLRFYPHIEPQDIRVTLIHSRAQILPEINPKLRDFARGRMEDRGITIELGGRVVLATPEGVRLADGRRVDAATVVCTIGSTPAPFLRKMEAPMIEGRLATESDMRLQGWPNAWAIGDCARITNAWDGEICPPTGQFAEREGRQAAENIVRVIGRQPTRSFRFRPLGQLCSIGGHTAVAEVSGVRVSGFLAWFLWRGVYLFKMPTWSRKMKVGFDWAWALLFARDLVHLRADRTERVGRAHHHSGDWIFRQGDPGTNFYIVENGEVEVVRHPQGPEGPEEVLAVLGPGDFFGEMALINNAPRSASIRARSPVDTVVVGSNVFSQISRSLAPLRNLLADAVNRRSRSLWKGLPAVRERLERSLLSDFVDPWNGHALRLGQNFGEALSLFSRASLDLCCVLDAQDRLTGLLSRTDLIRALEKGAQAHTPVEEFMIVQPIAVTLEDSSLTAAETMRDHGLKGLPVVESNRDRRVRGFVRAEKMLYRLFQSP